MQNPHNRLSLNQGRSVRDSGWRRFGVRAEIVIILIISCAYSGVFTRTGMLNNLLNFIEKGCVKIGRFSVSLIVSILTCVVFCTGDHSHTHVQ